MSTTCATCKINLHKAYRDDLSLMCCVDTQIHTHTHTHASFILLISCSFLFISGSK
ncbi:hypothetical protein ANANG_G00030090, partial [Anguilla anguilla]